MQNTTIQYNPKMDGFYLPQEKLNQLKIDEFTKTISFVATMVNRVSEPTYNNFLAKIPAYIFHYTQVLQKEIHDSDLKAFYQVIANMTMRKAYRTGLIVEIECLAGRRITDVSDECISIYIKGPENDEDVISLGELKKLGGTVLKKIFEGQWKESRERTLDLSYFASKLAFRVVVNVLKGRVLFSLANYSLEINDFYEVIQFVHKYQLENAQKVCGRWACEFMKACNENTTGLTVDQFFEKYLQPFMDPATSDHPDCMPNVAEVYMNYKFPSSSLDNIDHGLRFAVKMQWRGVEVKWRNRLISFLFLSRPHQHERATSYVELLKQNPHDIITTIAITKNYIRSVQGIMTMSHMYSLGSDGCVQIMNADHFCETHIEKFIELLNGVCPTVRPVSFRLRFNNIKQARDLRKMELFLSAIARYWTFSNPSEFLVVVCSVPIHLLDRIKPGFAMVLREFRRSHPKIPVEGRIGTEAEIEKIWQQKNQLLAT